MARVLLDSGICTIYELLEADHTGMDQRYKLREKSRHYYGELTVGYGRHYEAKRSNESIDKSLRIWRDDRIAPNDICEIAGKRYRIQQIQPRTDEDGLLVTDLALESATAWEIVEAEVEQGAGR